MGSVFWFELNSTTEPQLEVGITEAAPIVRMEVGHDASLRTVLYVEDNSANLKLIEQLIARRADIRLLTAGDGTRGIELARATCRT